MALTGTEKNAYTEVQGLLAQYGLQSLSKVVLGYVKQGYSSDAVNILIQQTPEWKQRFAGNTIREKNGLAPLDPATYLSTEASYADAIRAAGLPAGFYDGGNDFANWIGGDVSASEVQERASDAASIVDQNDPATLQAFQDYYGVSKGNLASYFLDQSKATPILEQQAAAAQIGGAAIRQGLSLSANRATQFAGLGVSSSQANSAYQTIAATLPTAGSLSQIYHTAYGQQDLENELLGGSGASQLERQALGEKEEAQFAGSGGAGSTLQDPGAGVGGVTSGKF